MVIPILLAVETSDASIVTQMSGWMSDPAWAQELWAMTLLCAPGQAGSSVRPKPERVTSVSQPWGLSHWKQGDTCKLPVGLIAFTRRHFLSGAPAAWVLLLKTSWKAANRIWIGCCWGTRGWPFLKAIRMSEVPEIGAAILPDKNAYLYVKSNIRSMFMMHEHVWLLRKEEGSIFRKNIHRVFEVLRA